MVEYFEKAIILYQEGDFCQRSYCDTERIISTPPELKNGKREKMHILSDKVPRFFIA